MAYNDKLVDIGVTEEKLRILLADTLQSFKSGLFETREEFLAQLNLISGRYLAQTGEQLYEPTHFTVDTNPSSPLINQNMKDIALDLELLYGYLGKLNLLVTSLFNQEVLELEDLIGRLKRTRSKLNDFKLITNDIGLIAGESFSNLDGLDPGSTLLTDTPLSLDNNAGVLTLPIRSTSTVTASSIKVESSVSNGVLGNNEDLSNTGGSHAFLGDITDGNPDTWAEYENIVFSDETSDLKLKLGLTLDKETIVNYITIVPVNFGLLTDTDIVDIQASADGKTWSSVLGYLPEPEYLSDADRNQYKLGPRATNSSGVFAYYFLPVKAKFISVELYQPNYYLIDTALGAKKRYAVGIKSIDVGSTRFQSAGHVISKPVAFSGPVSKVLLLAAYNPVETTLSTVDWELSFDGGTSWSPIQPVTENDMSADEIVNSSVGSNSFLYRLTMKRLDEAFSSLSSFDDSKSLVGTLETFKVSTEASPVVIKPSKQLAVDTTVLLMEGPIGARGDDDLNKIRFILGQGTGDTYRAKVPFSLYPSSDIREDDLQIYVAGKLWSPVADETALEAADDADEVYYVDDSGFVVFGDGHPNSDTGHGKSPREGATIALGLGAENLFFQEQDDFYVAQLELPTDGSKGTTKLEYVTYPSSFINETIQAGETTSRTGFSPIQSGTFQITERTGSGVLSPVAFITEVSSRTLVDGAGDYYVDYKNGLIYSYSGTQYDRFTTVTYKAFQRSTTKDYGFVEASGSFGGVSIEKSKLVSQEWTDTIGSLRVPYGFDGGETLTPITAGVLSVPTATLIRLSQDCVLKGTIVFQDSIFGSGVIPEEVSYIDGYTEIHHIVRIYEEQIDETGATGVYTFTLKDSASIFQAVGLTWSDTTTFASEQSTAGAVTSAGEWHIDYGTGLVTVYLTSGIDAGVTVSYSYDAGSTTGDGTYSVDYKRGLIFTKTSPADGMTVSYKYTTYRIHYAVVRPIDPEFYTVDTTENTIELDTAPLQKGLVKAFYRYDGLKTATLSEFTEFFTPIVNDQRFRVLTEGMI